MKVLSYGGYKNVWKKLIKEALLGNKERGSNHIGLLHLVTFGDSCVSLNFAHVNGLFRFQG